VAVKLGSGVKVSVAVAADVAEADATFWVRVACVVASAAVAGGSVDAGLGAVALLTGRLQPERTTAMTMKKTEN
jgi:hypothetical protein